jgi:hypothetical protein
MTGSPSIVPETSERDMYLVLDDFGDLGRGARRRKPIPSAPS